MSWYYYLLIAEFALAIITFISLFFVSAPYGRFVRSGWGITIKAKYGWFIMELPAVLVMAYFFFRSDQSIIPIVLILIWQSHYVYRTFFYPFQQSGKDKPFPIILVFMAIAFNLMNGYINGYEVFQLHDYPDNWLSTQYFIVGLVVFGFGYFVNKQSERILKNLRKPGETGYKIPSGGFFGWISCPHYFGEIIQWTGWAILTGSTAGWAFVAYTFANLAPRAVAHHRWYREHFQDYPRSRKALIPYIW